jgi:hypothetical protein
MASQALFAGLVTGPNGEPVEVGSIGGSAVYVLDDEGFRHHIDSEGVDRQVLAKFSEFIRGNEDLISESTMKAIGQEDLFTKAIIDNSLKHLDQQFDRLIETGLPEEVRAWLGMLGFQVQIDAHGEVIEVRQPTGPPNGDDSG